MKYHLEDDIKNAFKSYVNFWNKMVAWNNLYNVLISFIKIISENLWFFFEKNIKEIRKKLNSTKYINFDWFLYMGLNTVNTIKFFIYSFNFANTAVSAASILGR